MKNKIIYILFLVCYAFTSCSSQDKSSIPVKIESKTNETDSIKLWILRENRFSIIIPVQLKIENISKSDKVLWLFSLYVNKEKMENLSRYYTVSGEEYFRRVEVIKKRGKIILITNMIVPMDSLQTQGILNTFHITKFPTIKDTLSIGTYTEVIQRMKEIKMTNDSTLYNQVFKDIIFSIPVHNSVEDRKPRFINYNWLTNETYDKYPNSQQNK